MTQRNGELASEDVKANFTSALRPLVITTFLGDLVILVSGVGGGGGHAPWVEASDGHAAWVSVP